MQQSFSRLFIPPLAGVLLCTDPASSFACATCGCTLSADAAMGYSASAGWRINLEDDYINQDQLRSGTGTSTPSQVVNAPSDPALGGGEIEKQTINRYLTLGINYSPNSSWNLNLLVPYVNRDHTTYGVQLAPYSAAESAPDEISGAHVSGLGDIRLIGSYQGELGKTVELPRFLTFKIVFGIEVFNLARKFGFELRNIELLNEPGARYTIDQPFPVSGNIIA